MGDQLQRLGRVDHLVGAACTVALLAWSAEIASAVSAPLSVWLEGNNGETHILFLSGVEGPVWGAALGLAGLGLFVAGSDELVLRGYAGVWAPVVAALTFSAGGLFAAFRGIGDRNQAIVLAITLGVLLTLALASYWCVASVSRRVRTTVTGHSREERAG